MKKRLLTLALSCMAFATLAEEKNPGKTFLTLRSGLSVPTGLFKSKDFENSEAGFANNGFHLAAEYGGFFHKNFGLGLTYGIRRNSFDVEEYNKSSAVRYYANSGWRTNYLLVNPIFRIPSANNFAFYLKAGGGISFNTYPELTLNGGLGASQPQAEPKLTSEALAYGFGGGFKWDIDNIGLGLEVYSLNTSPNFIYASTEYKQEMNTLNYSFNLSYNFR